MILDRRDTSALTAVYLKQHMHFIAHRALTSVSLATIKLAP